MSTTTEFPERSEIDSKSNDDNITDSKSQSNSTSSKITSTATVSSSSSGHSNGLNKSTSKTLFDNSMPTTPVSLTASLSPLNYQQSQLQVRSSPFAESNSNDHYHSNKTQYPSDPTEFSHYHCNKFGDLFHSPTSIDRRRIVLKNGEINMRKEHVEKRSENYLENIFVTLIDIPWRYTLLAFTLAFLGSWLLFAIIWYIVAYFHGDLGVGVSHERCVIGVSSFSSAFLFSFESQLTIGFGNRYPHESCVQGISLICNQCIYSKIIECVVVGFVFAKLGRPKPRSQTVIFSRHALINTRNGALCLVFRVGDVRIRSFIIDGQVLALLISKKTSYGGAITSYYHESLKVSFDSCGTSVFLAWPSTIYHIIDKTSPFYSMGPEALANGHFEIVVTLKGIVESTGQSIQARTSYMPDEIDWGRRFERSIDFCMKSESYRVDYGNFDETYEINTPRSSAEELNQNQH